MHLFKNMVGSLGVGDNSFFVAAKQGYLFTIQRPYNGSGYVVRRAAVGTQKQHLPAVEGCGKPL